MIIIPGGAIDLDGTGADNYVATFTGTNTIGGEATLTFAGSTLTVNGAVVFNETHADVDFRVEGDTNANLLFVDGGEDRVGIGTGTPVAKFTVIGGNEVSNALIDTHADFVFNDSEARIQIVAEDTLSNAASIILTNVVGSNDNNNWVIAHKGPSASNDFRIAYRENTSAEDVVALASNRLAITTAGAVTFYGAVDLQANTLTTTGSIQGRTIDYSDGDLAMTIADGGGVTFAEDVTFTTGKTIKFPDNGSNAGAKAVFGTGSDLQIFHDHVNSYIDNSTGYLILGSDSEVRITKGAAVEFMGRFIPDDAVHLYHSGDGPKFSTTASGVDLVNGLLDNVGNASSSWADGHLLVVDTSSWAEIGGTSNQTVGTDQLQSNWYSYNNSQFIGAIKMMTDYAASDRGRLVFRIGDDTNGNTDLMEVGKEGFYKRARNANRDVIHEMVIEAYAAGTSTWVNLGLAIPSTVTDVWTRGIVEIKVMGHTSAAGNGATIQTWYYDLNDSNDPEETTANISTTNSGSAPEARCVISSGNCYAQIRPNQSAGHGAFYGMAVVKFYLPRGAGDAGDTFTWNTNNSMIN